MKKYLYIMFTISLMFGLMFSCIAVADSNQQGSSENIVLLDDEEGTINKLNMLISKPYTPTYRVGFGDSKSTAATNPGKYAAGKGYGIVDINGKVIFRPGQYSYVTQFVNNVFLFEKDKKFGLMDSDKNVIVQPIYDEIEMGNYWEDNKNQLILSRSVNINGKTVSQSASYELSTGKFDVNLSLGEVYDSRYYASSARSSNIRDMNSVVRHERNRNLVGYNKSTYNFTNKYHAYEGHCDNHDYCDYVSKLKFDSNGDVNLDDDVYVTSSAENIELYDDYSVILKDDKNRYSIVSFIELNKSNKSAKYESKKFKKMDLYSAGNGVACVLDGKKYGFINVKDEMFIETDNCETSVSPFINSVAWIKPKGSLVYSRYDIQGNKIDFPFEIAADRVYIDHDELAHDSHEDSDEFGVNDKYVSTFIYRFETHFPTKDGWKYNEILVTMDGRIIYPRDWNDPCHDTGGNVVWRQGECKQTP